MDFELKRFGKREFGDNFSTIFIKLNDCDDRPDKI